MISIALPSPCSGFPVPVVPLSYLACVLAWGAEDVRGREAVSPVSKGECRRQPLWSPVRLGEYHIQKGGAADGSAKRRGKERWDFRITMSGTNLLYHRVVLTLRRSLTSLVFSSLKRK